MFRVVLLFSLALMTVIPLHLIGVLPPPSSAYTANFDRLWRALDAAYPYFELEGIDWQAAYEAYRPQIGLVKTGSAYIAIVGEMLADLGDRHTGVLRPRPGESRVYFGTARALTDGIAIDQLGATAERAGLVRGDRVVSVDGMPIEQALLALPLPLRSAATAQHRRNLAASNVLSTAGASLTVTIEASDGTQSAVTLEVPARTDPRETEAARNAGNDSARSTIKGERLSSGLGYIRIPTLGQRVGEDLVAEFDAALDALFDAPALILDLRGNGGGDSRIGDRIAGRLLDQPFIYGWERFRLPLPQRLWIRRFPYVVLPRKPVYHGPMVVLIDSWCFSSAEMLVVALRDSGRAVTVGRTTAGGSGNPVRFSLPAGGLARFSTGSFRRGDGMLIEGRGIRPDVDVPFTVADFRNDRDPDLEAAEALLLQSLIAKP